MIRVGSLCTGYDGIGLGLEMAGFEVERSWFGEVDSGMCRVLAHHWPDTKNLGDITAVDWSAVEPVDVLTAGFPCQDLSLAGARAGLVEGNRSGLWYEVAAAVAALRPPLVVIENVEGILSAPASSNMEPCPWCVGTKRGGDRVPALRALGAVLGDLSGLGYDAVWTTLAASDIGAPHQRKRVFVLAYPADAPSDPRWVGYRTGGPSAAPQFGGLAATTAGGDSLSLLPTPAARDAERGFGYGDQPGRPLSETVARLLPTPAARLADRWGSPSRETAADRLESGRRNLEDSVALLPTPRVAATRTGRSAILGSSSSPSLDQALELARGEMPRELASWDEAPASWRLLPTPRATDGTNGGPNQRGSSGDLMLPSAVCDTDRWGQYAPAIARWETVLGRPAPDPTEPNTKGQPRLSPRFVEWMQGLPAGHVTDHTSRTEALRGLGNGVVPQQCAVAVTQLLAVIHREYRAGVA
jgi:DNA (cytosine-5)-methyltransferase 1